MTTGIVPADKAREETDPDTEAGWLLFSREPEAELAWIEKYLTIYNELGQEVQMRPFPQQKAMARNRTGRDVTVKGRQTRASTYEIAANARRLTMGDLVGGTMVVGAQDDQTTATFRNRIRHHFEKNIFPVFGLEYKINNNDEIVIAGLENRILFVSGEQKTMGRSYSAQIVHLSEFAHWNDKAKELLGGVLPAVPSWPFGQVHLESTPKGEVGAFYEYAMNRSKSKGGVWTTHLYPWWLEPRYRVSDDPMSGCDIILPTGELNSRLAMLKPDEREEMLIAKFGLAPVQILWRQIKKPEQDATLAPFLQEYPEDLDTCWLGVEGKYFDTPDGVDRIQLYRDTRRDPVRTFDSLTYNGADVSFYGPNFAVWELPDARDTYVAGHDAAGGGTSSDSDWSVMYIMSVKKEKIVAKLRVQAPPEVFALMVAACGAMFHSATINGEASHHGREVFRHLQKLMYPNLYYYVDPQKGLKRGQVIEPGMYPTEETRRDVLTRFRTSIVNMVLTSGCSELVREMNVFTWQKVQNRLRVMAMDLAGNHDDCIFAAAYAWYIIDKVRGRLGTNDEVSDFMVDSNNMVIRNGDHRDDFDWSQAWRML